ncbi:MAG: hypothetical protein V4556_12565 [Bacteroidota bacterium]
MGRQLNREEETAFLNMLTKIEQKYKDFFESRNDHVANHITYTIDDTICYMEWKPNSDLTPKIRHEISRAFHSMMSHNN